MGCCCKQGITRGESNPLDPDIKQHTSRHARIAIRKISQGGSQPNRKGTGEIHAHQRIRSNVPKEENESPHKGKRCTSPLSSWNKFPLQKSPPKQQHRVDAKPSDSTVNKSQHVSLETAKVYTRQSQSEGRCLSASLCVKKHDGHQFTHLMEQVSSSNVTSYLDKPVRPDEFRWTYDMVSTLPYLTTPRPTGEREIPGRPRYINHKAVQCKQSMRSQVYSTYHQGG